MKHNMDINEVKKRSGEKLLIGGAFFLFILVSTYKLSNASLWYDETIEYWFSKIMVGYLPFEADGSENMYQRILTTYQPPLYNFLLYFWLKISDSVWWFRFFGVVMGFIGMVGLYKSIYKATENSYLASGSVMFSTFVYQLLYYWQECAEYCIMLASLFWATFFWISIIKEPKKKNIIGFTISAIFSVYSQYGAAFPILVMGISSLIAIAIEKKRKCLIEMIISYSLAGVFAAMPLYVFFMRKQMNAQSGSRMAIGDIIFEGGIVRDQLKSLLQIFKWNLTSYYSDTAIQIFFGIVLVMIALVLVKGSRIAKGLIVVNVLTWELYYLAVKCGIYSYGNFGNRYNIFFIPIWIVTFFVLTFEVYRLIERSPFLNKLELQYVFAGASMTFCLCFCFFGWSAKIQNNWTKEESRNVTAEWIRENGKETETLVYYGANAGFAYYIRSNENYDGAWEKNVTYMPWFRSKTPEQWKTYLNETYGVSWPKKLYVVATHVYGDELDVLSKQFTDKGYKRVDLYNTRGSLVEFIR